MYNLTTKKIKEEYFFIHFASKSTLIVPISTEIFCASENNAMSHDAGHLIGHAVSPNEIRGTTNMTKFRSTNNFATRAKAFKIKKGFVSKIVYISHLYLTFTCT